MKTQLCIRWWLLVSLLAVALCKIEAAMPKASPREHWLLDANWKFHLGDDWPELLLDKAGNSGGPTTEKFNDTSWRTLDLPHDWAIELPFDKNADASHGFKPIGPGFPHNSVGWYRRKFELPASDQGKRIWLQFDGVYRDARVWVNGWIVGHHENGYYPFRYDITDIVHCGGTNTIAVRVDASKFEGWFYEGAGIYRHVWLNVTDPLAIAPNGIFVYSKFKNNVPSRKAEIHVQATLLNTLTSEQKGTVECQIIAPDGERVAKCTCSGVVAGASRKTLKLETKVYSPELWSPETPKLYHLVTTVEVGGKAVDQEKTTFGIRTAAFDSNKGFLLNGKHYELKGTCNHQDMAGVGEALPDALQYFRIRKLKEFGCNAYRTAHNPPTPELLDACDRLGMIVMDENRLLGSDARNMARWKTEILRDRNHPSVCIWSIANEEFYVQNTPQGANVARSMQDLVHRLDPTRPVTYASPGGSVFKGINSVIQVRGWNYHVGPDMDNYHTEHPNQPEVGTEQGSTLTTRGIYKNDKTRGYVSAYDVNFIGSASTAEKWWSYFDARPWLSGGFVWTGFDYRGEPLPYSWPCISSHFGILDTCGFPKDLFYYYKAWWTTNTVLHLLPHWDWPGREGHNIDVWCFSNCKQVELFLNGESLGRQTMPHDGHLAWQVKYEPGTLSAKGYDTTGKVIAETGEETPGGPAAIQLTPDRSTINADGEDVSVVTISVTDAQGRVVPVATNLIYFSLSGAGRILGVGNGDPSSHEPDTFILRPLVKFIPFNDWRWKLATNIQTSGLAGYGENYDDVGWDETRSEGENYQLHEDAGLFRQHLKLTAGELAKASSVQLQFGRINDYGWIYVNGHYVGESRDWSASPVFEIKHYLHAGDNVVAVGVKDTGGGGGIQMGVSVEVNLTQKNQTLTWQRSVFNGLAEVIVQSTKKPGTIKLTATADGLKRATVILHTQTSVHLSYMP